MSFAETLSRLLERHDEVRDALAHPLPSDRFAKLSKEYAELTPVTDAIRALDKARRELAEAEAMLADPDMKAEAQREAQRDRGESAVGEHVEPAVA